MIVAYLNGKALTTRCYGYKDGENGLFVRDGKEKITNLKIKKGNI